MPYAADFVALCQHEAGDRYVYGAEVNLNDPDPKAHGDPFDCSELVQWGTFRVGTPMPDGSAAQLAFCKSHGTEISVAEGIATQGALLFIQTGSEHHVAVSLGNGSTIEARGKAYGVGNWGANGRPWTHAGLVPGLTYSAPPAAPVPSGAPSSPVPGWPGRYLRNPMHGADVHEWQSQMHHRGWSISVDGAYGPKSESVCAQFQRQIGLHVDGVVGPVTWKAAWAAPIAR
ncbi:MAG TPA: peptidoglycan-binding protein [Acidimicrobiales bacterium]|nr:peptidoglycan-binding protein [Acidimicrobiales bacterium]